MTADILISQTLLYLKKTDTVATALDHMEHANITTLPVVDNNRFIGMVSEAQIMDEKSSTIIGDFYIQGTEFFVHDTQHYFDILKAFNNYQTSVIAVLNENEEYIGSVVASEVITYFSNIGFVNSPGGILVLSVSQQNYSMAEISRIIEANDVKILCSYVSDALENPQEVAVTLKLNKSDLSRVIASFERFGYKIIADFHESVFKHHDTDRLEMLLKYLSI